MLTEPAIRAAKPREKAYKIADSEGLYLHVSLKGTRVWRYKFKFGGIEKLLTIGKYPAISLASARARRIEAQRALAEGVDPAAAKQAAKAAQANAFIDVATRWLTMQEKAVEPETVQRIRDRVTKWLRPIHRKPVDKIQAADVLDCLRRIEAAGLLETAHRTRADVGRIFRHAVASGIAQRDPTADLKGALAPVKATHFAAIVEPRRVGELLRAIDGYQGQPVTMLALKLAPLLFVRPGELRAAEWSEIDLDAAEWRIPAEKMKMRRPHVVPLARQAVALFRELEAHTGEGRLCFPAVGDPTRPLSENTLNAALRRLGLDRDEMSSHGFRSTASTLLNEAGYHPDLIELQLAHAPADAVRAIYNRSQRLDERRTMMQAYADLLDKLRGRTTFPC